MEGKLGTTLLLHSVRGTLADRVLLVGLGKERDFRDKEFRQAIRSAVKLLNETGSYEAVIYLTEEKVKRREVAWRVEHACAGDGTERVAGTAAGIGRGCRLVAARHRDPRLVASIHPQADAAAVDRSAPAIIEVFAMAREALRAEHFAMELAKSFEPHAIEAKWYPIWESRGYFKPGYAPGARPYCIQLPPPNVTGTLHMGHAFQQTLMDVLIRYHRMKGDNTLWQLGTDHAGIATQIVVEQQLKAAGQTRHDLGREAFNERVWQWKGCPC